jgi:hypothetical protein
VTTIEILGAEPPADPPAPLKGRVVVLTVALLVASVALLAMFASPESVTTRPGSPETSPTNPAVGDSGEPTSTFPPPTSAPVSSTTSTTTTTTTTVPTRVEMDLVPAGTEFGWAEPTTQGITVHNVDHTTFSMGGPSTRLAFGFDSPVIVHQAGAPYGEVSPTQPLIRITTSDGTRTLPTGELKGLRLLHASLIEERPIVLYASTDRDNIASLHVFDLETEAAADLGIAGAWQTDFIDAFLDPHLEAGDVIVYRRDQNPEAWDLAGNATVLDEEVCGC